MISDFLNLDAEKYHHWRENAEFFAEEKRIILPFLENVKYRSVLDIGCGTGTWSRLAVNSRTNSFVVGTDISNAFTEYASGIKSPQEDYLVGDFRHEGRRGEFDLVISAMSSDYIGFQFIAEGIARSLRPFGQALVWVRDPCGYEIKQGLRIKRWVFEDELLVTTAPIFTRCSVHEHFRRVGLAVSQTDHVIRLKDGKPRRLLVYSVFWPNSLAIYQSITAPGKARSHENDFVSPRLRILGAL
jgi:SAM-dependent methyltransferase